MRKKEIDRKLEEIIDFSGVERYIDTPVKRYSSGMYVRLAFAVTAFLESEILIIDEVLAVGDSEFQKKCLGKMGEVSKSEGRTVLFVSHNLDAIQSLCKKGMLMAFGSLEYFGGQTEVISKYFDEGVFEKKPIEFYRRQKRVGGVNVVNILVNGEFNPSITNNEIVIKISAEFTDFIKYSIFNFDLKNQNGVLISNLRTGKYLDDSFELGLNDFYFVFKLPSLVNGQYFLDLGISPMDGGLSFEVILDYPIFSVFNNNKLNQNNGIFNIECS
jgi:lipopolysaccharide transport system ATP-binding protein